MNGAENNLTGMLLVLIPVLPLVAALVGYIVAARRRDSLLPAWLGGFGLGASGVLSGYLLYQIQGLGEGCRFSVPWLTLPGGLHIPGGVEIPLALQGAPLQLIFSLTTGLIGLVVMVFAFRERRDDPRRGVFFSTLTLFAGGMLLFLTADTLLLVYFAWELMGLCSYLLIAHPGTREAWRSARQAFWTTRATDFGLLFAVIITMMLFNWNTLSSINIDLLFSEIARVNGDVLVAETWLGSIALLVLLAVIGKAAQFPLSFWLADAMVAPASVSALLHAATMVAAGPYLLIRFAGFLQQSGAAMLAVTLVGGLTLLLGAVMALCAREPKRILAYSTVSHLGLVVMSVGVLAEGSGYFHLLAHAWFKAALFLGVGYLVLAWTAERGNDSHAADLNDLAGYARRHPLVLWGILVPAGLSLAGLPLLAGSLGKEQVLYALLTRYGAEQVPGITLGAQHPVAAAGWLVGSMMLILSLPLTVAYITRLIGILGFAQSKVGDTGSGSLQPPKQDASWNFPLWATVLLALMGSIGLSAVYFGWYKTSDAFAAAMAPWRVGELGESMYMVLVLAVSVLALVVGGGVTWYMRVAKPGVGDRVFREGGMAHLAGFFRNGMYLKELFTTAIGRTGEFLAILAGIADIGFVDWLALRCGVFGRGLATVMRWIDDYIVDGLRWCVCEVVWFLKRIHSRSLQTGQIQFYMLVVLISAVLLCFVILRPMGQILATLLGR